ncbi:MAG: PIN domain-containing protein, partial [Myxococcota bacterium]
MAFTVIYDACVLYSAPLRDLLIRLGTTGLFRARWTDEILDEVFRNIIKNRPDLDIERLDRTRELMNASIRDVLVENYKEFVDGLTLPDSNDRHVLAAAIRCNAQVIVTWNTKDFPSDKLSLHY